MDELYDKIDLYLLRKMSLEEQSQFETEMSFDRNLAQEVEARRLLIEGMRPYSIVQRAEKSYWEDMSEVIDRYLLDKMTETERRRFEDRLKWDTELHDHLETQRLIMTGIRVQEALRTVRGIERAERLREYYAAQNSMADSVAAEPAACAVMELSASAESSNIRASKVTRKHRTLKVVFSTIGIAACLFLAIIPAGHFTAKNYGESAFTAIERSPSRSASSIELLVETKQYEEAIVQLKSDLDVLSSLPQDEPGVMLEYEETIYELASVQLLNGEISDAKKTLDLYRTTRVISPLGEQIIELRKKLWWIIW